MTQAQFDRQTKYDVLKARYNLANIDLFYANLGKVWVDLHLVPLWERTIKSSCEGYNSCDLSDTEFIATLDAFAEAQQNAGCGES